MRVSEGGTRPREAPAVARSKAFGDAMRRAREGSAAAARGAEARESGFRTASARRTVADGKDDALAGRRQGSREEERLSAAVAPPPIAQGTPVRTTGDVAAPAELRAVLRALPVAIDASRVRDGAPLTLTLGRALDVDVRAGHAGVEVVLRPDARLARATEAELPGLVASLRSCGIAVARAEVRARGGEGAWRGRGPASR